jgi:hypothetical protein
VPRLAQMRRDFTSLPLQVWSVTTAPEQPARAFGQELGVDWPILTRAEEAFRNYGVRLIPQVYLVDPAGFIVADSLDDAETVLREQGGP